LDTIQLLELLSILVTLTALSVSSLFDLRTREVPDKLWLAYGPIGLTLTILKTFLDPAILVLTVASIGLATLTAFGMVYFGLFGGADAKALICIGLTIPLTPSTIQPILGYVYPFFPITAILTSYLCSFSTVIWQGSRNLIRLARGSHDMFEGLETEPSWKKALAFVTGYRTPLQNLRTTPHLIPMEEIVHDEGGEHRKLRIYSIADTDPAEEVSNLIKSLSESNTDVKIWVTPALPMLLFILAGVIVTLVVGDPIFKGVLILAGR
jgi:preflagellin peptidase FlaK